MIKLRPSLKARRSANSARLTTRYNDTNPVAPTAPRSVEASANRQGVVSLAVRAGVGETARNAIDAVGHLGGSRPTAVARAIFLGDAPPLSANVAILFGSALAWWIYLDVEVWVLSWERQVEIWGRWLGW